MSDDLPPGQSVYACTHLLPEIKPPGDVSVGVVLLVGAPMKLCLDGLHLHRQLSRNCIKTWRSCVTLAELEARNLCASVTSASEHVTLQKLKPHLVFLSSFQSFFTFDIRQNKPKSQFLIRLTIMLRHLNIFFVSFYLKNILF